MVCLLYLHVYVRVPVLWCLAEGPVIVVKILCTNKGIHLAELCESSEIHKQLTQ